MRSTTCVGLLGGLGWFEREGGGGRRARSTTKGRQRLPGQGAGRRATAALPQAAKAWVARKLAMAAGPTSGGCRRHLLRVGQAHAVDGNEGRRRHLRFRLALLLLRRRRRILPPPAARPPRALRGRRICRRRLRRGRGLLAGGRGGAPALSHHLVRCERLACLGRGQQGSRRGCEAARGRRTGRQAGSGMAWRAWRKSHQPLPRQPTCARQARQVEGAALARLHLAPQPAAHRACLPLTAQRQRACRCGGGGAGRGAGAGQKGESSQSSQQHCMAGGAGCRMQRKPRRAVQRSAVRPEQCLAGLGAAQHGHSTGAEWRTLGVAADVQRTLHCLDLRGND